MSAFEVAYTLVAMISFVLGIGFSIIDGMLLWGIVFFSIAILLILMKTILNIAGWVENVTRKLGEREGR